jgi:hypothetical protein
MSQRSIGPLVVAGFGVLWGMIPLKMLRGTAEELDGGHDDACFGGDLVHAMAGHCAVGRV